MFYTVKDPACTRSKKSFKRQGVHGALEDCHKMARTLRQAGLIDQAFCKSWDGMGVLGGQDVTLKRSIQIGDAEVNRWYFYDGTPASEPQVCVGATRFGNHREPRPQRLAAFSI